MDTHSNTNSTQDLVSNFNKEMMGAQETIIDSRDILPQQPTIKLSKQRWLILIAMTLYGLISAISGEFGVILNTMLKLLDLPLDKYIYIGQLFMYIPAIASLPTAWFLDKYGFRTTIYISSVFMILRSVFRALLFYPESPNWEKLKVVYWIIAGMAASQSAAIFFVTPLKIAENWFSASERSIAWTIMMSSYGVGNTIAAYTYPRYIHGVEDVKPLAYYNLTSGIFLLFIVVTFITRSKPKYPPSERTIKSSANKTPWLRSIRILLTQRDILLHIFCETIFNSMQIPAMGVIQSILTTSGHSEIFVGDLVAINSIVSVIFLITLSSVTHRVKNIALTCRLAVGIRGILFVLYMYTILYPFENWVVLVIALIYNIWNCWLMPNNNNMMAQMISGTVSEATVSATSVTLYVLSVTVGQVAFVQMIDTIDGKPDYTRAITMASIVAVINALVYLIFFRGQPVQDTGRKNEPSEIDRNL